MKHIQTFQEFLNESNSESLNEGYTDDRIVQRAEKYGMSLDDAATLESVTGRSMKFKKELAPGITNGKISDFIDDYKDGCYVNIWYKDKYVGRNGRTRTGRTEMSVEAKEFLKDYLPSKYKIEYSDPNVDIVTEPTKKDIAKMKKFGKMEYQYYQGGFPSNGTLEFDDKKMNRLRGVVKRIGTREEAIRLAMAFRSIYGWWSPGMSEFKERCAELDCTPAEMESIKDYDVDNKETVKFKF